MLAVKRNEDDLIYAYVDYKICNQDGTYNDDGEYCFVWSIWAHPKYRRKEIMKEWLEQEHKKFPKVKWLYFKRSKNGGKIKMYSIERMYE